MERFCVSSILIALSIAWWSTNLRPTGDTPDWVGPDAPREESLRMTMTTIRRESEWVRRSRRRRRIRRRGTTLHARQRVIGGEWPERLVRSVPAALIIVTWSCRQISQHDPTLVLLVRRVIPAQVTKFQWKLELPMSIVIKSQVPLRPLGDCPGTIALYNYYMN